MDRSEVWSAQERAWLGLWSCWGYAPASFSAFRARCGGVLEASSWEVEALCAQGVPLEAARGLCEASRRGGLVEWLSGQASSALGEGRSVVRSEGALGELLRGCLGRSAPPYLFVWGEVGLLEQAPHACAALVGSREADEDTQRLTRALARGLAEQGVVVVSGGARGVDTAAHEAALEAGGKTLAVLGGGLDQLYPATNRPLFRRVVEQGGLLLSPFAPKQEVRRHNFPRRNPLIAALSVLTIVTRAGEDSGSLLTAREALRIGRGVLAVPGSLQSPEHQGANRLLVEGAWPLVCAEHLPGWVEKARALLGRGGPAQLGLLPPAYLSVGAAPNPPREAKPTPPKPGAARAATEEERPALPPLEGEEARAAELLRGGPRHQDELCRELGLSAGRAVGLLLGLELRGRVARGVGGVWRLSP